jgi:glycosyltransferase involved in cell wall biosynthesis
MNYDLVFFPDYRVANPYQRLLYDRLGPLHPQAGTIDDAIRLLDRAAPGQAVIFHLHWEDTIYRHIVDRAAARQAVDGFLTRLVDFVDRGGTLVWTIHNHGSHAGAHPDLDQRLRQDLSRLADRIHVHALRAAAPVLEELEVPSGKLIVLPHGNYHPIHDPRRVDQASVRSDRGWTGKERVVLLFGRLDAYKGGADMLQALVRSHADLRLVVAGKQVTPLGPDLQTLPGSVRERVTVLDGFVPEQDVDPLFAAVDAVVLPYRSILTSGTLMLALTMGKPVIAPALPAIEEVVRDGRDAVLYPPGSTGELAAALARVADMTDDAYRKMAKAARATGRLHDWSWIARQFGGALMEATVHGRAIRRRYPPMGPSAGLG